MTVAQLSNLCDLLEIDIPEATKTKVQFLKLLIAHIFADCDEATREAILDKCCKPKAAKPVVADNDLTHNVIAELGNDPENTDVVKEAKDALKEKRKRELTAVLQAEKKKKTGARAKAKTKAKSKAKAKAQPKAKAKAQSLPNGMARRTIANAKGQSQARATDSAKGVKKPRLPQRPEPVETPPEQLFWETVVKEEPVEESTAFEDALKAQLIADGVVTVSDDEDFFEVLERNAALANRHGSRSSRDPPEDEITCPGSEHLIAGVDPLCPIFFHDAMTMAMTPPDAAEDVAGQPEPPQGEPADAAEHPVAPGGADGQGVATSSTAHAKKKYPSGTQKQYERPEVMKQLDCCPCGKITIDPHAHRFVASHSHTDKQKPVLVDQFLQQTLNRSFGCERTWQDALKECHFWLWTKHSRLHQKQVKKLQTPGDILDTVLQEMVPIIQNLPGKVDYGGRKKLAKGSTASQPQV